MRGHKLTMSGLSLLVLAAGTATSPADRPGTTERVSLASRSAPPDGGSEGNGHSTNEASLSRGALHVAFASDASNLVPDDTNAVSDVFVRNRARRTTERVSLSNAGQFTRPSTQPVISADGRVVAFTTRVPETGHQYSGVYVRDLRRGRTELVSVGAGGAPPNASSFSPSLSGDGRFVVFASQASNLVPGDQNAAGDVFVHDRAQDTTTRVSIGSFGESDGASDVAPGGAVSADGRFVVFTSFATNLVAGDANNVTDLFLHDTWLGSTRRVGQPDPSAGPGESNGYASIGRVSGSGRDLVFVSTASNLTPGDTNGLPDVFAQTVATGEVERVSVTHEGDQLVFVSAHPSISDDGRWVAFDTPSGQVVPGDTNAFQDVFVRDRQRGVVHRVSVPDASVGQSLHNGVNTYGRGLDPTGRFVVFESDATNVVVDDTNGFRDIFLRRLPPP